MKTGRVLTIQRYSIHDGPGIRSLVFMKGCPLRCSWCANPESQKGEAELRFIRSRCVSCGKCAEVCRRGAITILEGGHIRTDRENCGCCGACADVCASEAREIAGENLTVERIVKVIEDDRDFYAHSGGGVTIGGGEPLQQHAFVRELLKQCKERWLHTAMETSGYAPWGHLREILEHLDVLLFDLKHMDPVIHTRLTGVSNALILENLERIVADDAQPEVVIRVPIIPGLNDSESNLAATAKFASALGHIKGIELLPYHPLGVSKYEQFGMEYSMGDVKPPEAGHVERLREIIESFGLGTD